MDKPIPVFQEPALDYHALIEFIENKYKINIRDYAGKFFNWKRDDDSVPFLDFWGGWLLKNDFEFIHNGSYEYIHVDYSDYADTEIPTWVREILDLINAEFSEHLNEFGDLRVWVEW